MNHIDLQHRFTAGCQFFAILAEAATAAPSRANVSRYPTLRQGLKSCLRMDLKQLFASSTAYALTPGRCSLRKPRVSEPLGYARQPCRRLANSRQVSRRTARRPAVGGKRGKMPKSTPLISAPAVNSWISSARIKSKSSLNALRTCNRPINSLYHNDAVRTVAGRDSLTGSGRIALGLNSCHGDWPSDRALMLRTRLAKERTSAQSSSRSRLSAFVRSRIAVRSAGRVSGSNMVIPPGRGTSRSLQSGRWATARIAHTAVALAAPLLFFHSLDPPAAFSFQGGLREDPTLDRICHPHPSRSALTGVILPISLGR